jgi:predicted small lipoprotein YifL
MKNTIITVIMAATILIAGCGKKSPSSSRASDDRLEAKVTLTKPYPLHYNGDESDRISVQFAACELANQAKLGYDFGTSLTNAGDACRIFIKPEIRGIPLREALDKILRPEALTYDIHGNFLFLKKN